MLFFPEEFPVLLTLDKIQSVFLVVVGCSILRHFEIQSFSRAFGLFFGVWADGKNLLSFN